MVDKKILLIDDQRNIEATAIARTYDSGIFLLTLCQWDILLLDHDLGCIKDGREYTGYDVLCFLEEQKYLNKHPEYIPKEIILVTDNGAGMSKMKQAIKSIYS